MELFFLLFFFSSFLQLQMSTIGASEPARLIDIISVEIQNKFGGNSKTYGRVNIMCGSSLVDMYNRDISDYETVESITLTYPPSAACTVTSDVFIGVDLKDVDFPSPKNALSKGNIRLHIAGNDTIRFNGPITNEIYGNVRTDIGITSARVRYMILSDGARAIVEARLIKLANNQTSTLVYGGISARWGDRRTLSRAFIWDPFITIPLFNKNSDENISLSLGDLIPLSKSVVSMPKNPNAANHNFILLLRVYLYGGYNINSSSRTLIKIATGSAQFPVPSSAGNGQEPTVYKRTISSEHGEIKVKVTWKTKIDE